MKKNNHTAISTAINDNRKINSYTDYRSLGIALFKDKDLNLITKNSGPLAKSNEYQVHYWFLNGRFTMSDGSNIDIAIPTVYFNYEQEVDISSVDFNLTKVDEMSERLEVIHNMKVNELLSSEFATNLQTMVDTEFEWKGINLGTIHRHPSGIKSFSGTDLTTKIASPGICFPLAEIEEGYYKPSFSSILLHEKGRTVMCRTEYRLVNKVENNINYYKGRCATGVHGGESTVSIVEKLLGVVPTQYSYTLADNAPKSSLINMIIDLFKSLEYSANTDFIKPENVKEALKTTYGYGHNYGTSAKNSQIPGHWTAEYKKIAEKVEEEYSITLKQRWDVTKMTVPNIIKFFNQLEVAYYGDKATVHKTYTYKQLDEIMELQQNLWLEEKTLNDLEIKNTTPNNQSKNTNIKSTGVSTNYKLTTLKDMYIISDLDQHLYNDKEIEEMYELILGE